MTRPPILAIVQNPWVRDPESVRRRYDEAYARLGESYRRRFIAFLLFGTGCPTGRRIRQAFGEEWTNHIIFEEASRLIGGKSSDAFPADIQHLRGCVDRYQPSICIGFGRIACAGLRAIEAPRLIETCHPPRADRRPWCN